MRWRRLGDAAWFLAWAIASSVWCLTAAAQLGPTFDEPFYVERGLDGWRHFSHGALLRAGTMPLPIDVQTLPLYLWEQATGSAIDPVADLQDELFFCRAATLVFWWLLLWYARLAGRQLAGPWGGRLAVALLACEPSLLAHAGLATTDIAISACLLALLYHFRIGREAGWFRRQALPALWFGLAILSKASAVVYGPICLVIIEVERLSRAGAFTCPRGRGWRQRLVQAWSQLQTGRRDLVVIGLGGLALAFLYCGSDRLPQPSFIEWTRELPAGPLATAMVWLAEHLRIFSNAGEGLVRQIKHNMHGHGTYLLGVSHPQALWYYFPVLMTIKLSLLLLLAPLGVAAVRARALANWACLAALMLLVASLNFRVQIGVRLVLPLIAIGGVGIAAAAVEALRTARWRWMRPVLASGLAMGLVWTAAAAATIWPQGLCYVNDFWGGSKHGCELVSDSNYDWGQGLPELAAWQRRHGGEPVDVWYFGTDPAIKTLPVRYLPLQILKVNEPADLLEHTQGRFLAVSTTMLYGATTDRAHRIAAEFLRTCPPAARTTTFVIYDCRELGERSRRQPRTETVDE